MKLEDFFPALQGKPYWITSCATLAPPWYNCVAWAIGDDTQWWEATGNPGTYWPPGVPDDGSLDAYLALFRSRGYEVCGNSVLEAGCEKVAIYVLWGEFTHVAYQRDDGVWLSKLGRLFDIEHDDLDVLASYDKPTSYGAACFFMRRPRRSSRACPQ